jgi:hypothetical protein
MDGRTFQDVFTMHMPVFFDYLLKNPAMGSVPQHFLANNGLSRVFAEILLTFLIGKLK